MSAALESSYTPSPPLSNFTECFLTYLAISTINTGRRQFYVQIGEFLIFCIPDYLILHFLMSDLALNGTVMRPINGRQNLTILNIFLMDPTL